MWTFEKLKNEASKYKTRGEFNAKNPNAYRSAYRKNLLGEFYTHTVYTHGRWTLENLTKKASNYKTRADFQKYSRIAYCAAWRMKILDRVCAHMKPSYGSSVAEKELLERIKNVFNSAKSKRYSNISIPNKPHIKGLEIDIYVPELNKGIEFDGTYWHSFEGLKNSRKRWPDEDIKNYHQIKDTWFASKGIQILHIKEEDWIKDKEGCVKSCLSFLFHNSLPEFKAA